jgi:2-dehydropantoate 2-reductase
VRYVIVGAGAVGGTIGGRLAQHGHEVVLVARGAHAAAMRDSGLTLRTPDGVHQLNVPVAAVDELKLNADDVLILAVKTQDSAGAIAQLAVIDVAGTPAGQTLPLVCAQNGVENERLALRYFRRVYGVYVALPATHLEPGVVIAEAAPKSGILDIGRYPTGVDETAEAIAADLSASRLDSVARADVMRWKYAKLLGNLGNALDAIAGRTQNGHGEIIEAAHAEGRAALAAAGITPMPGDEVSTRRGRLVEVAPVEGHERSGSSSWQSLARGTGSIEADYLNGEIGLLGRLHGVPTPVNDALQQLATEHARRGLPPGTLSMSDVRTAVDRSAQVS